MKVRCTTQAEQDRFDIMTHSAEDNVRASIAMDELFGETASRLEEFPMLGMPGLVAGTRELIAHERYRLIYDVDTRAATVSRLSLRTWRGKLPPVR
ncbi:type II toxin-antitoxin system RelE/ParE family toxin [Piscinibacter aquaticus]|uniref:Type II toxin-antitoxin system RelE/ParE family toxin n=1 Tax=Piscinibacter aquaticus TaxID=392597 RepID=A0A5C6TPK8_9BURK|nr:type II toxin-antitoxin system RelE/ParE family toxin [Piscinibacter aquaticus]